jgi:hypothetical protein
MGQSGEDSEYIPEAEDIINVLTTLEYTTRLSPFEKSCIRSAGRIIEKVVEIVGKIDEEVEPRDDS